MNHPHAKKAHAPTPRFGAHLSVAGGLHLALEQARSLGCECLQVFVKNQRQWRAAPLRDEHIHAWLEARRESQVDPVVAHASYLLNLASPEEGTRRQSIVAMIDELTRCEALGLRSLIFHPGAHLSGTLDEGIAHVSRSLNEVFASCAGYRTLILLESTAGQGSAIGWHFDHLARILDGVSAPERAGVCLDTCHLFAAGNDFRSCEGYEAMIGELDRAIGCHRVRCVHMNDSVKACGSRVDRHAHIGKGEIGKEGFAHFVNDLRFAGLPMILETPKGTDGRGTDYDKVNLKRLRGLVR